MCPHGKTGFLPERVSWSFLWGSLQKPHTSHILTFLQLCDWNTFNGDTLLSVGIWIEDWEKWLYKRLAFYETSSLQERGYLSPKEINREICFVSACDISARNKIPLFWGVSSPVVLSNYKHTLHGIYVYRHKHKYMVVFVTIYIPRILESNPHTFYSFSGLKNQMRIRIACGLDSRSRAGFWKNDRAAVRAVRTIQQFIVLFNIYNII